MAITVGRFQTAQDTLATTVTLVAVESGQDVKWIHVACDQDAYLYVDADLGLDDTDAKPSARGLLLKTGTIWAHRVDDGDLFVAAVSSTGTLTAYGTDR